MSRDSDGNDRVVFHKICLSSIIGQGAVEWMSLNRSAQARKKLKQAFPA